MRQASPSDYVEFKDICKAYGRKKVLSGVSLTIREGELLSLLGPSGCGKTTLLRILAGFVTPSRGEVKVGGKLLNPIPPNKRNVGMVFQHYCLFPHMTVYDNVTFGLRMRGLDRQTMDKRAMECLDLVHLADLKKQYPGQLSGGMKQRIALARVLAFQPSVLLLDEPFAALDRNLKDEMQFEVRKLQQLLKITTLFVTHDQKEAMTISDRIAVMNYGLIEQEGRPLEIYDHPRTKFVAEFLGVPHFFSAKVLSADGREATVELLNGKRLTVPVTEKPGSSEVAIAVRAERIQVAARGENGPEQAGGPDSADCLHLSGVVTFTTNAGYIITYEIQVPDGPKLVAEVPRQDQAVGFEPDDEVEVTIMGRNCTLIER
jgi:ABC-type Fe3+/spermidine/putrescine transport system ATPase subunit